MNSRLASIFCQTLFTAIFAVNADAKAIPWLLLSAKSGSAVGTFAQIASIQRINTEGGQAPTEVCNQTRLGKEARIPYKAVYRFYVLKK